MFVIGYANDSGKLSVFCTLKESRPFQRSKKPKPLPMIRIFTQQKSSTMAGVLLNRNKDEPVRGLLFTT
jgi:hypothetical protein